MYWSPYPASAETVSLRRLTIAVYMTKVRCEHRPQMDDEIERNYICDNFLALQTAAVHKNKAKQFIRSTQMLIYTKAALKREQAGTLGESHREFT